MTAALQNDKQKNKEQKNKEEKNEAREVRLPGTPARVPSAHLDYLDGLRGLAALYVVVHHAWRILTLSTGLPALSEGVRAALGVFAFGRLSVDVFIVLSGYCLMLPVARSGEMRGGVVQFARRRVKRILPPYYAALALSLAAISSPFLRSLPPGVFNAGTWPAWDKKCLLAHIFLVHNWNNHWILRIDGPLWSVATEWQIYFVFALVLLPVWRRWGILAAAALAFLLGVSPHYLLHGRFDAAAPQFLALFGFGMAGAVFSSSKVSSRSALVSSGALAGGAAALLTLWAVGLHRWPIDDWREDCLAGAATAFFIAACRQGSVPVFSSRPAVRLGTFSYSLYLIHFPVLLGAAAVLVPLHLPGDTLALLLCFLGTCLAVLLAYLFHLAFERPFMSKSGKPAIRTERQAEAAAIESPAP